MKKTSELHLIDKYTEAVPPLTYEEEIALRESIIKKGVLTPLEVRPDLGILDGRNRFLIAQDLGLKPEYNIRKFNSEEEEFQYVLECNLTRRQLNKFQRIELYYQMYLEEKKIARKRRHIEGAYQGKVTELIGEKIGISDVTVRKGIWLNENASKEDKIRLRLGEKTITGLYGNMRYYSKKKDEIKKRRICIREHDILQCPKCFSEFTKDTVIIKNVRF